jgi:hypothetical protein
MTANRSGGCVPPASAIRESRRPSGISHPRLAAQVTEQYPRVPVPTTHRSRSDLVLWFTEGFDTTDLKDAKALLDELR